MDHAAIIRQYLRDRQDEEFVAESFPFVTISRQSGAGGHAVGREILRKLDDLKGGSVTEGWEMFDHKLCLLIAEDKSLGVSFNELLEEKYRSEIGHVITELLEQRSRRYELYKRIFEIVRMLAMLGKSVIVGRGGMCIAGDLPLGVHIRLIAPEKIRITRIMELYELDRDAAIQKLKEQDRDRHRFIHDFFGKDSNDPLLYDAVYNTERLTFPEIAESVARLALQKMEQFKKTSLFPKA